MSNCHKQPADLFVRELLTPDEIINALAETHAYLRRINPDLRFVLTVSPVRHLKDTLQLNAVSKSVLRLATHIVSDLLPCVAYFPAYELLVDDLRDYRFYASDMLHPSEVAEDYIWEKFARAYFDADFGRFRKEWAAVRQSLGHRPLHEGAPEHRQFLESTREKLEQLSLRKVDVAAELRTVQTKLAALPLPRLPEPVEELEDDEERIDIGEGSEVSTVVRVNPQDSVVADAAEATLAASLGQSADVPARAPRLSPEEFRAQRAARSGRPERGRRDGRGKGQSEVQTENEQFQTAALTGESDSAPVLAPGAAVEALAALEANLSAQVEVTAAGTETGAEQEPAKKKKRRSRGGAKRTARKHALRLAAEMGLSGDQSTVLGDASGTTADTGAEAQGMRPEGQKSSVIVKSQPVKRGGRRNEAGQIPRVALFAAPLGEPVAETPQADAELPTPQFSAPEITITAAALPEIVGSEGADEPAATPSRNSRNRKKKKAAKAALTGANAETTEAAPTSETTPNLPIATAVELSGTEPEATELQREEERREVLPVAALPKDGQAAIATVAEKPAADGSKSARRNKSRAVSGARAEKPAVDTPVVPVSDPTALRTQVAAGRLTGSSATLVEPIVPVVEDTPKAITRKASAPKGPVTKAAAAKAAQLAGATPAAAGTLGETNAPEASPLPKGKATAKAKPAAKPQVTATLPDASVPEAATEPAVAKRTVKKPAKASAKNVETPSASTPVEEAKPKKKAVTKKAAAKPVDPKSTVEVTSSKAKTPKAAAKKAPAAKPTAKPKAPGKSAS